MLLDVAIVSTGQGSMGDKESSCWPLLGMMSVKDAELSVLPGCSPVSDVSPSVDFHAKQRTPFF